MLLKTLLLLGCLALIQGAAVKEADPEPIVHILNDAQMAKFLSENPDAIKLNREITPASNSVARELDVYQLKWTLGSRQSGDGVAYSTVRELFWFEGLGNPTLAVQYPTSGTGKIVTYVTITTLQSSPFGDAYVSAGGIGQRNIEFYVLGYYTYFWSWDIQIYGKA